MSSGRTSGNTELGCLLDAHYQRTGVPALITVDLGTRTLMSPRDAIRETFASATEFLVMGRFLIAKDYFALRRS